MPVAVSAVIFEGKHSFCRLKLRHFLFKYIEKLLHICKCTYMYFLGMILPLHV